MLVPAYGWRLTWLATRSTSESVTPGEEVLLLGIRMTGRRVIIPESGVQEAVLRATKSTVANPR